MDKTIKKLNLEFCGRGMHKIAPQKLLQQKDAIFLDVRSSAEAQTVKFDFSVFGLQVINIPLEDLPDRLEEIPKDRLVITFCSGGTRAAFAYVFLLSKGFEKLLWFEGGYVELVQQIKPSLFVNKKN